MVKALDRTVLIFSASFGNGHQQAARAIEEKLIKDGYKVKIIDTFYDLHPLLHKTIMESYLKLIKLSPKTWKKLYYHTEERPWYKAFDQLGLFFTEQLYSTIEKHDCPFIISTQYFATALLATVKRKKKLSIPLYAILTDFSIHPAYLRDEVDGYFAAANLLEHTSVPIKLPANKIFPTGIPIRPIESLYKKKSKLRQELNLKPELKTVMIAGGGIGLTKYLDVIKSLEMFDKKLQLLCMTGNNTKVQQKIEKFVSKHEIKSIGFTDKFTDYMQASDVLISKAGGLSMAEALTCEIPVIIFDPIPGHEEQNAKFLINAGTAVEAEHQNDLPFLLKRIFYKKGYYEELQRNAKRLKQPNAAEKIIDKITQNEQVHLDQHFKERPISQLQQAVEARQ